jgi:hypothetical protein
MRRLVAVLLGIALGAIVGIMAAIPILVVLNIVGVTGFREDLPLHGVIPFIATLWGCTLLGGIAGAVVGWRRSTPASPSSRPERVE